MEDKISGPDVLEIRKHHIQDLGDVELIETVAKTGVAYLDPQRLSDKEGARIISMALISLITDLKNELIWRDRTLGGLHGANKED